MQCLRRCVAQLTLHDAASFAVPLVCIAGASRVADCSALRLAIGCTCKHCTRQCCLQLRAHTCRSCCSTSRHVSTAHRSADPTLCVLCVRVRDLSQPEHSIDGRTVDVKRAVPKSEAPGPSRVTRLAEMNKIFVGGLAPSVTVAEFRTYFEGFGAVVDAVVMFDRQTQRSRGFGFVTFQDDAVVQNVLMGTHELNGARSLLNQALWSCVATASTGRFCTHSSDCPVCCKG
jgi:RNA recognition motif. (a.k.a. RRM, RBD, or RNP domain)